jgi:hypothetical protein
MVCDPDQSGTTWTPANGGACDDGDDCTKDDYCQTGVCKGVYYGTVCSDEYGCTDDVCDGLGGCVGNTLKSDWCLISGVCYQDQTNHPSGSCKICDVSQTQTGWTDITNTCLINGMCQQAGGKHSGGCAECDPAVSTSEWTVKGNDCLIEDVCYKPQATDSTGCSECDPTQSKTSWTPLAGLCKIGTQCYSQGDKHTGGCAECDPLVSATTWTVKGSYCLVDNVCKNPQDLDTTGCGECDPTKDMYAWSAVANTCLFAGKCYQNQQTDTSGCLTCDSVANPNGWTATGTTKTTTYDFETGTNPPVGWTISNSDATVGWQVSNKRASGGSYALYYGDPVAGDYDTGSNSNNGTATLPAVTITASKKAGMTFALYMDTESGTSYDNLEVLVGTTQVWQKSSTTVPTMEQWQEVTIDLSSYAGQTITIQFSFDTSDDIANSGEGVYVDDITIYYDC